jgi:hypothetical protein
MDRDAFPGFLQSKALGNLIPQSMFWRHLLGFFALWAGLWAGFVLIFLDMSHATRCWVCSSFSQMILQTLSNFSIAHSSLYYRRLLLGFIRVVARPNYGLRRRFGVHLV